MEYGALSIEHRAFSIDCGALSIEYRAVWIECIYVYIYIYIYLYMYMYIYIYVYMYIYTHTGPVCGASRTRSKYSGSNDKVLAQVLAFLTDHTALLLENVGSFDRRQGSFDSITNEIKEDFFVETQWLHLFSVPCMYIAF